VPQFEKAMKVFEPADDSLQVNLLGLSFEREA
jgi:hypothetical protein